MQAVRRPVRALMLPIAAYVVLAVVAYWPVVPLRCEQASDGERSRARAIRRRWSWFLAWTPFALLHGHNPFFTNYIDFPVGVNLAANTSVPLLGLLASARHARPRADCRRSTC